MPAITAIAPSTEVKDYCVLIESNSIHFAHVQAFNKEDALSQINDFNIQRPKLALRDLNNNKFDIEAAEDWSVQTTAIEDPEPGEMEEIKWMTSSGAHKPEEHQ